jgi:type IV pilus assembly protein PilC
MLFWYKALQDGKFITGRIESSNTQEVVIHLKSKNLFPVEIKPVATTASSGLLSFTNKISFSDIVNFTRQLSLMLNAGLTLLDALTILRKQTSKPLLVNLLQDIDKEIKSGKNFSSILQKYPRYFSKLYVALVKAGEASGKLNVILLKLADNLELQREFKAKVRNALIYPVVILVAISVMMFIMITFVIPQLLGIYEEFQVDLPASTKFLIFLSGFFSSYWIIILIAVSGTIIGIRTFLKTDKGRLFWDKLVLKIPLFNKLISIAMLVDATRTLSVLIGSGVSILDSINIIIDSVENKIYQNAFRNIYIQIEKGVSLGDAMTNERIFPQTLVQMTIVGEQTGHLDETLGKIADYYQSESELTMKGMITLIEPAILVFLGLTVGYLVLSIITPIYSLTSSFK